MDDPAARRPSWRSFVPWVLGLVVVVLGLLLLLPSEWQAPIESAGGLVMAGTALAAHAGGKRGLSSGLAILLLAAAVMVLRHGAMLDSPSNAPAPSTGIALLFAAGSILVSRRSSAGAAIFGVAVTALALVGMAGPLLELKSSALGTMPIATATACLLLGIGLTIRADRETPERGDVAARYTPYATGATCLLATVLFWQSLVTHQEAELQRVVEMTAVGSLAELGAFVKSVTHALEHIADEWNTAGRLPAAQWRYQCRLVLERLGGPRAVEWIDDQFDVIYLVAAPSAAPGSATASLAPAPPVDEGGRRALVAARVGKRVIATPTFELEPNVSAFRLAVPLSRRDAPDGYASAVFLIDQMLDELLATRIHDYVITVFEGDRQVYGPRGRGAVAPCASCRSYTLDLPGGRSWELSIRPSAELRGSIETSFPEMILTAGILISFLLTAMLQLLGRERRSARDLARANRSLQEEVTSRRTAEEEIRTLATELEQRVRDRTGELASSNTALRNENALRQRAQATLESANGNLRQFASFVSHELRQPLATMALWSELLETNADVALNERGRGYMKQIRAAIDRMTGFLEAQLRLARVTYTQPTFEEDVDLAALIREVVGDGTLGLHAAHATVQVGDVPTVHADSGQLRQLFRNLLENAIKYRRPDMPLLVRIDGRITTREQSRYCEIRFSDNGQGFAERDAEKIFDLFEQLPGRKSAGSGSGVGLAICRRIVEHHGGTIRAEGRPGEGATFVIDLPLERCEGHAAPHPETLRP